MSETTKTIVVIAPSVPLGRATIRHIETAGYIVLRCLPHDVKIIGHQPLEPLVLQAALEAIGEHMSTSDTAKGNGVRNRFARNLAAALGYATTVELK